MLPPTVPRSTGIITHNFLSSSLPFLPSPPPPPPPPPPHFFFLFAAALSFFLLLKVPSSPPHLPPPPPFLSFLHPPRRRHRCLKLRTMKSTTIAATTAAGSEPPSLAFSSPEFLAEWLGPRLPSGSLASWGIAPGTKTLHNLWLELVQGETSLLLPHSPHQEQQRPLRTVHVATVRVRNPRGALLVESHQLLSNGTVRPRLRPLSEKMRPGESVEDAAVRAVREELGGAAAATVRIVPGSFDTRVEERASASYPGLPACYVLHSIDVQVEGLPEEGEFSTEEAGEGLEAREEKAVFVRRHFWKWVEDDGSTTHLWA